MNTEDCLGMINNHLNVETTYKKVTKCDKKVIKSIAKKSIHIHAFFITNTFISNSRLKLAKNQARVKQYHKAELSLIESYSLSSFTLSSKNNSRYSKKCTKSKYVCLNEVIW